MLPFANLSADKENEYFSDGLAEEIINALTHVRGLKVTARTSAFAFRGEKQDIRKIAETLGVRTILEGSVRRAGSRIRVSAQLINAADGYHLWSERYDAEMADVFAVQDEISSAIAGALKLKLSAELAENRRHTPELPAFEALLKGRHYQFDGTPEGLRRSKEYFEKAISLDPEYALAHAALASYYWSLAFNGLEPAREVMGAARESARKSLELDPSLPEALAAMAVGAATYDYDWKASERWFQQAMAADSVTAGVRWCYAFYHLLPLGHLDQAVKELERALESDPLNFGMRVALINGLHDAGLDDRAIALSEKALETDKSRWSVYLALARIHAFRGDLAAALDAAERAYRLASWNVRVIAILAAVLIQSGERVRADALVEKLNASANAYGTPMALAVFHAMCGETDAAADWLEKAIEQRDPSAVGLSADSADEGLAVQRALAGAGEKDEFARRRHVSMKNRWMMALLAPVIALGQGKIPAEREAAMKADLAGQIDGMKKQAQVMVDSVFSFGELGFQEFETSKYLSGILEKEGFKIERGIAGIPTAWVASWGQGKPVISLGIGYRRYSAGLEQAGSGVSRSDHRRRAGTWRRSQFGSAVEHPGRDRG